MAADDGGASLVGGRLVDGTAAVDGIDVDGKVSDGSGVGASDGTADAHDGSDVALTDGVAGPVDGG